MGLLKVFISYRRADTQHVAGRLGDRIDERFTLFMDIDNIPLGVDYRVHIRGELLKSEILIVVIGPRWLAPDPDGASMPRTSWAA